MAEAAAIFPNKAAIKKLFKITPPVVFAVVSPNGAIPTN